MFQNKSPLNLSKNKLFSGEDIGKAAFGFSAKNIRNIKEGEIIFKPGDASTNIYLILEGEVKLKISGVLSTPVVIKKKENDFFGEKEVLEKTKRTSSAVANSDSQIFIFKEEEFKDLLKKFPKIKKNLPKYFTDEEIENKKASEYPQGINLSNILKEDQKKETETSETFNASEEEIKSAEDTPPEDQFNFPPQEEITDTAVDETDVLWDFALQDEKQDEKTEDESDEINQSAEPFFEDFYFNIEEDDIEYKQPEIDEASKTHSFEEYEELDFSSLLNSLMEIFSSVHIDSVKNAVIREATNLTSASWCYFFIYDKDSGCYKTTVTAGESSFEFKRIAGEGIEGVAAEKKNIINIQNVYSDSRFHANDYIFIEEEIKNILAVPVYDDKGNVPAVIELFNSRQGAFTSKDEKTISLLAPGILSALQNAQMVDNLLQREKFMSLSNITHFIINDINNPVKNIKHYTGFLRKKNLSAEVKQILDLITEQANSVLDFGSAVKDFASNQSSVMPEPLNIEAVMDDILALLAEYVEGRSVKLFKRYDTSANVLVDKKGFYQACFQITKNACDSMSGGGNFFVTVSKADEKSVNIEFKDTGIGIPDSLKDQVFEPFFSHGKPNNIGLGLPLAKKIIENHKGKIQLFSTLGDGTTIVVSLPIIE
jgi:signal transduction histidine kinase